MRHTKRTPKEFVPISISSHFSMLASSSSLLIIAVSIIITSHQPVSQARANVVGSRFSPENLQAAQQAEAERVAKAKIAASRARLLTNTITAADAEPRLAGAAADDASNVASSVKKVNVLLQETISSKSKARPNSPTINNDKDSSDENKGKPTVTVRRGSSTHLVDIAKRRNRQQQLLVRKASSNDESTNKETNNEIKEEEEGEEAKDKAPMPKSFAQSLLNAGRAVDLGKLAVELPQQQDESSSKNSARDADVGANNKPTKTASELLDELAKNLSLANSQRQSATTSRRQQQPSVIDDDAPVVEPKSPRGNANDDDDVDETNITRRPEISPIQPSVGSAIKDQMTSSLPSVPLVGQNWPAYRDPAETRVRADQHVPIDRLIHRLNRDGSYTFGYESVDGFKLETRFADGQVVGRYGYYDATTGQLKVVEYGADKNLGFVPKGDGIQQVPQTVVTRSEVSSQNEAELHELPTELDGEPFVKVDFSGTNEPQPPPRTNEPTSLPPPPSPPSPFPGIQQAFPQQPFLQVVPGGFLQPQPSLPGPRFGAADGRPAAFFFGPDGRLTPSGGEQQVGPSTRFIPAGPPQQQQGSVPPFFIQPLPPALTNQEPRPLLPPNAAGSRPQPSPTSNGGNTQAFIGPDDSQTQQGDNNHRQPAEQPARPPAAVGQQPRPQQQPGSQQENRFFIPFQQPQPMSNNPVLENSLFIRPPFRPGFPGVSTLPAAAQQPILRPQAEQQPPIRPTTSFFSGFQQQPQQQQQQRPFTLFNPQPARPTINNSNQFINRPPPPFAGFGSSSAAAPSPFSIRGDQRHPQSGFFTLAPFQQQMRPGQQLTVVPQQLVESPAGFFVRQQGANRDFDTGFSSNPFFR